jgi:hypothetical protein
LPSFLLYEVSTTELPGDKFVEVSARTRRFH